MPMFATCGSVAAGLSVTPLRYLSGLAFHAVMVAWSGRYMLVRCTPTWREAVVYGQSLSRTQPVACRGKVPDSLITSQRFGTSG